MKAIICVLFIWIATSVNAQQGQKHNLVGTWKFADIKLTKLPKPVDEKEKQKFIKDVEQTNVITLKSDNTFEAKGVEEDIDMGTWKLDADGKTLSLEKTSVKAKDAKAPAQLKDGSTDKIKISSHSGDLLRGKYESAEGVEAMIELQKVN